MLSLSKSTTLWTAAACTCLCVSVWLMAPGAQAGRLKAQVLLTQDKIPKNLSERGLIAFARKHRAKQLREKTDDPIPKRKWRANMVVSFNAPPGDMEFHVLFYDVTGGKREFIEDLATMINDRKQRTFLQKLKLKRPRFAPNKRIEMVVTVKRQEVARATFDVVGAEEKRSGVVNFSDEETK